MLCQACNDMMNRKSARWKGSYKATFGSGDGSGQPTSTESTTLDPDAHRFSDCSEPGGFVHHRSGRAFLAAADEGCQLCLLFVYQLSPEHRRFIAEEPEDIDTSSARYDYVTGYSLLRGEERQRMITVKYTPRSLGNKLGPIRCTAILVPSIDQEPLAAPDISYPKVVGQGEKSLSLVRQWIAACEKHENCRLRSLSDVYQTKGRPRFARIIDVQDGSTDPRLSDVGEVPVDALYMTLSHCWGNPKHKPLTLTLDTLADMKMGIPWKKLPKTFADAIVFTRNMGVQYIWIDSLCIIQDSTDDWASQSAAMCEIYSGSYLNLAATGAADSRGGLFSERDERSVQPLRVARPLPPENLSSSNGVVRYYDVLDGRVWVKEVEGAPLCRRGWIVQERALARRCLHFGKRQLHWECTTMEANESVPLGYDYSERAYISMTDRFKAHDPFMIDKMSRAANMRPWAEHETGHVVVIIWRKLVEVYTQGGLTKETDKLVAISGLARALAAQSGIQYLAGLWRSGLVQQLLWFAESPSKRPDIFRAPSWSWASTNSQICWEWDGTEAMTILGARPSGSFTTFTSSPLTIRGALIPGILYESKRFGDPRVVTDRKNPIGTTGPHRRPWGGWCRPDSDFEQDNLGSVLLLPVGIGVKERKYELYYPYNVGFTGLVLKTTGVKGTLRRVGSYSLSSGPLGGETPLRNIWLLDHIIPCDETPLHNAISMDHDNIQSKTDPLEGVSEDMYHHYEEIGNLDDRLQSISEEDAEWTRMFSGGFIFDLV